MKIYWGRPPKGAISRDTAMGCLATNVALPGFGTVMAGKPVLGIFQAILGLTGLALTLIYGVRLFIWMLTNWNRIYDPNGDPMEILPEMFSAIFWPLVGIFLVVIALVWSVLTTLHILRRAGNPTAKQMPPPI